MSPDLQLRLKMQVRNSSTVNDLMRKKNSTSFNDYNNTSPGIRSKGNVYMHYSSKFNNTSLPSGMQFFMTKSGRHRNPWRVNSRATMESTFNSESYNDSRESYPIHVASMQSPYEDTQLVNQDYKTNASSPQLDDETVNEQLILGQASSIGRRNRRFDSARFSNPYKEYSTSRNSVKDENHQNGGDSSLMTFVQTFKQKLLENKHRVEDLSKKKRQARSKDHEWPEFSDIDKNKRSHRPVLGEEPDNYDYFTEYDDLPQIQQHPNSNRQKGTSDVVKQIESRSGNPDRHSRTDLNFNINHDKMEYPDNYISSVLSEHRRICANCLTINGHEPFQPFQLEGFPSPGKGYDNIVHEHNQEPKGNEILASNSEKLHRIPDALHDVTKLGNVKHQEVPIKYPVDVIEPRVGYKDSVTDHVFLGIQGDAALGGPSSEYISDRQSDENDEQQNDVEILEFPTMQGGETADIPADDQYASDPQSDANNEQQIDVENLEFPTMQGDAAADIPSDDKYESDMQSDENNEQQNDVENLEFPTMQGGPTSVIPSDDKQSDENNEQQNDVENIVWPRTLGNATVDIPSAYLPQWPSDDIRDEKLSAFLKDKKIYPGIYDRRIVVDSKPVSFQSASKPQYFRKLNTYFQKMYGNQNPDILFNMPLANHIMHHGILSNSISKSSVIYPPLIAKGSNSMRIKLENAYMNLRSKRDILSNLRSEKIPLQKRAVHQEYPYMEDSSRRLKNKAELNPNKLIEAPSMFYYNSDGENFAGEPYALYYPVVYVQGNRKLVQYLPIPNSRFQFYDPAFLEPSEASSNLELDNVRNSVSDGQVQNFPIRALLQEFRKSGYRSAENFPSNSASNVDTAREKQQVEPLEINRESDAALDHRMQKKEVGYDRRPSSKHYTYGTLLRANTDFSEKIRLATLPPDKRLYVDRDMDSNGSHDDGQSGVKIEHEVPYISGISRFRNKRSSADHVQRLKTKYGLKNIHVKKSKKLALHHASGN